MRRARRTLLSVAAAGALYLLAGYVSARLHLLPSVSATEGTSLLARRHEVTAVLHVHTHRSHDAVGDENKVARAARAAGIDVVLITDHRDPETPDSLWRVQARTDGGVLLLRGQEVSLGEHVGRVLVFGLETSVRGWQGTPTDFADLVAADSATAIIAHPRSPRTSDSWRHPETPGISGWEAFDFADIGRTRLKGFWVAYHLAALAGSAALGQLPASLVRLHREGTDQPGVAAFDSIYRARHLTALGGLDVHPKTETLGALLPDYEPFFRAMANHIQLPEPLPANPDSASRLVLAAVRAGGVYISFFDPGRARGFRFAAYGADGEGTGMGGVSTEGFIRAELPAGTRGRTLIRVVRDGETERWVRGRTYTLEPRRSGAYRVEAYRYTLRVGSLYWNLRPWIFSNPIRFMES